jgi:hypothetical protein
MKAGNKISREKIDNTIKKGKTCTCRGRQSFNEGKRMPQGFNTFTSIHKNHNKEHQNKR